MSHEKMVTKTLLLMHMIVGIFLFMCCQGRCLPLSLVRALLRLCLLLKFQDLVAFFACQLEPLRLGIAPVLNFLLSFGTLPSALVCTSSSGSSNLAIIRGTALAMSGLVGN